MEQCVDDVIQKSKEWQWPTKRHWQWHWQWLWQSFWSHFWCHWQWRHCQRVIVSWHLIFEMTSSAKMLLRIFRATFFAMTLTMTLTCHFDHFIDIKKMTSLSLSFWKWRHFDVIFGWQWRHQHTGPHNFSRKKNTRAQSFFNFFYHDQKANKI